MDTRLRTGLCSVTYRDVPAPTLVALAAGAGLRAIEWGADVHAPPGDLAALHRLRDLGLAHGLAVASYGSYFRAGTQGVEDFKPVLAAALALGAPRIRIWAGSLGSADADRGVVREVVRQSRGAARLAADHGLHLGFEFHRGTLTDTVESTAMLLDAVAEPNVWTYWQPPVDADVADAVAGLVALTERVCALHVFSWWPGVQRQPLAARRDLWQRVFAVAAGRDWDALLEFVPGDDPNLLGREAASLREMIEADPSVRRVKARQALELRKPVR
ncbi:sugar phosphate isomerase/epimerase family protein [Micromonospora globbae]|uniref:sugar phosphate isomerase/epimerase family protein n=1 Tax=Micromonospora globbae TaxID=1894969 RepID=UPI003444A9E8